MTRTFLIMLAVISFSSVAAAQSGACTEAGVKAVKAVAAKGALPTTSDSYFFSAALDKPVIGQRARQDAGDAVQASRKNESMVENTGRIIADGTGNMAYEYGTVRISYDDAKSGKHEDFTSAYLRVWKSDRGACKVAAEMAQPENNSKD